MRLLLVNVAALAYVAPRLAALMKEQARDQGRAHFKPACLIPSILSSKLKQAG
jgi:hypothetical protein